MASSYPARVIVKLQPCCKDAARQIREKQELGRLLQGVLAVSPFATLLGANPADAAVTVVTTDWDLWGNSIKAVPVIVRERCRTVAGLEVLNHKGGDLNRFWQSVHESFK